MAEDCFAEQTHGLEEGSVDAFWIETLSSLDEAETAIRGIERVSDKPIVLCMSFDTAGRTMMGLTPADLPAQLQKLALNVDAFGANRGLGPAELLETLISMSAAYPEVTLIARSNYGIPEFRGGTFHYHGTPELMAAYTEYCLDIGVRIIGGCCGTTPEVIAVMHRAIDNYAPREMNPETQAKIAAFIAENRTSPTPSAESKEPTDQPRSGRRSAGRSRARHQL
ncbi:MAG: homocysteine S-methyltransferase family protein [Alphaproteobacteria bacterium]|nr:homocysteine S-methyltransferase family protein [Alphaproteobacteria bacterium]